MTDSTIRDPGELLGRQAADPAVRQYLRTLGRVREWSAGDEQDSERYVDVLAAGVALIVEAGVIQAVTMYPAGRDDHEAYTGPLPLGLAPNLTQRDVRRLLGVPQVTRAPGEVKYFRRVVAVERYDRADWSVALEFDGFSGRLVQVQLMLPAAVPK